MKRIIYIAVFAILCIVGLSACSTARYSSPKYNSNYRAYQVLNLPADYPTKYLPNGNLWDDFRENMQLPLYTNNRRVREQIRWIQNNQEFVNRSLTRGAQYFYYIFQQIKMRHLPAELALIPVYESGYVPVGRSNRGAVGLWQFMPGTAAGYGMRMDRWYDGRRDVIPSTNAALKYFTYLHYFFNDWLLAMAAYNYGEGNVQAAILRNKRRGARTDFWSLSVPGETHVYVPQLLALAAVIKNPAKYGVHLVPINNGPYFERINVGKPIDINKYARLAGIDVNLMRSLNAGYLRVMMDPDGPYTLLVPRSKAAAFKAVLSGRGVAVVTDHVHAPEQQPQQQSQQQSQQPAQPSQAQVGEPEQGQEQESLSNLADMQQNEFSKEEPLLKVPNLSTQGDVLDDAAGGSEQDADITTTTVKTIPYKVAKGDTVYSIAKKFKVSPSELKSINKLRGNSIKVGKVIKIPQIIKKAIKATVKVKPAVKQSGVKSRKKAVGNNGNVRVVQTTKAKTGSKVKSSPMTQSKLKSKSKAKVSLDAPLIRAPITVKQKTQAAPKITKKRGGKTTTLAAAKIIIEPTRKTAGKLKIKSSKLHR